MIDDLRTDLAKAKGEGTAKSGASHWWYQRITAIILLLCSIWLIFTIKQIINKDLTAIIIICLLYTSTGELNLNFDNSVLNQPIPETAMNGKLRIIDLEYQYDPDFPALKKADTEITIAGSKVNFVVNQAYSSDSLLSGLITFEWTGMENSYFTVHANAKGEVIDLIDFISAEDYKKTKTQGIDLKKITGQANSKIQILIPTNPNIKNTYNCLLYTSEDTS